MAGAQTSSGEFLLGPFSALLKTLVVNGTGLIDYREPARPPLG
jgi:hypothetical protein